MVALRWGTDRGLDRTDLIDCVGDFPVCPAIMSFDPENPDELVPVCVSNPHSSSSSASSSSCSSSLSEFAATA